MVQICSQRYRTIPAIPTHKNGLKIKTQRKYLNTLKININQPPCNTCHQPLCSRCQASINSNPWRRRLLGRRPVQDSSASTTSWRHVPCFRCIQPPDRPIFRIHCCLNYPLKCLVSTRIVVSLFIWLLYCRYWGNVYVNFLLLKCR